MSNPLFRLALALRFGDLNLLITNQSTDDTQILFRQSLGERVPELAPFLRYDRDPYLVSADGRLVWIWDAYTTSDRYPDAQPLPADTPFQSYAVADRNLTGGLNYVRNSVKVVVDAYTGESTSTSVDPTDPIIAAYERIFPGLFQPLVRHAGVAGLAPALPRGPVHRAERGVPALPRVDATTAGRPPSTTRMTDGRSRPRSPTCPAPAGPSRRTT